MQALVFLHGFGLDGRMWQPQVDALGGRYRTEAPDLPGFGPRGDDGQSVARSVAGLCDQLGIARAHLVGLSLGGAVAVDFALTFPARVRSLTLVDAVLRGRPTGIGAWGRAAELAKEGRMKEASEAWLADPLFAGGRRRPDVFAWLQEIVAGYSGDHWTGKASTRFEVEDPASRLGEIRVPTLVVVGALDLVGFQSMADEYAREVRGARKVSLDGVGHLPSMEDPQAFNAVLGDFLQSID